MFRSTALCLAMLLMTPLQAQSTASAMHNRIDTIRADAPALAAYGAHSVGVRTLKLVNPGQINLLKIDPQAAKPESWPREDRPITVEIWYPADKSASGSTALRAMLRDGKTEVSLHGRAMRDATPLVATAEHKPPFPLVIISHGFPGNRFLLSPIAENIASKGYVVASIDHTDSTYDALGPRSFASTLINRPIDQRFVLDEMTRLSQDSGSFLKGLVDTSRSAVMGYSMGGYGALLLAGVGVTQASVDGATPPYSVPHGLFALHRVGSSSYQSFFDPRIKTVIAFAPAGANRGVFDAASMKGLRVPTLFIAGSLDDVVGYENGVRAAWTNASNVDRTLLTFDNANHNAGAPMPAPVEAQFVDPKTGATMANHYIDAVWDNVRMNNISTHFATAWLAKYLKGDTAMDSYFDLVPESNKGVWAMDSNNQPKPEHTHWKGFLNRTAKGLRLEKRVAEK